MTAATLIRQAGSAGVSLRLDQGKIKASGDPAALAGLVPQLREHRQELIEFLTDAHETTVRLLAAAMRACDHHNDSQAARDEMRADCLNTPLYLRADLLDHFTTAYPKDQKANR